MDECFNGSLYPVETHICGAFLVDGGFAWADGLEFRDEVVGGSVEPSEFDFEAFDSLGGKCSRVHGIGEVPVVGH